MYLVVPRSPGIAEDVRKMYMNALPQSPKMYGKRIWMMCLNVSAWSCARLHVCSCSVHKAVPTAQTSGCSKQKAVTTAHNKAVTTAHSKAVTTAQNKAATMLMTKRWVYCKLN